MILEWHQETWKELCYRHNAGNLPHALLITGPRGIGKNQLMHHFSQYLLCQHPSDNKWCGTCHACQLVVAGVHPNILNIGVSVQDSISSMAHPKIKVEQIRQIGSFVNQTSLEPGYKIILINAANSLNHNASNALLKTLEEPSENTLLILIDDLSAMLPLTIVSRCQRIKLKPLSYAKVSDWLAQNVRGYDPQLLFKLSEARPFAILDMIETGFIKEREILIKNIILLSQNSLDPVNLVADLNLDNLDMILDAFIQFALDLVWSKLKINRIYNIDYQTELYGLAKKLQLRTCLHILSLIQSTKSNWLTGNNLNKQIVCEKIFIDWCELTKEGNAHALS